MRNITLLTGDIDANTPHHLEAGQIFRVVTMSYSGTPIRHYILVTATWYTPDHEEPLAAWERELLNSPKFIEFFDLNRDEKYAGYVTERVLSSSDKFWEGIQHIDDPREAVAAYNEIGLEATVRLNEARTALARAEALCEIMDRIKDHLLR